MTLKKVLFISLSVLLITSPSAFAHTSLITSNPARGSVILKLPSKIALTFDDSLLTLGKTAINRVVVTDPTGVVITSGIDVVKGAVVTDAFKAGQSSRGKYTVSYRVSALDGHIVTGKFTFTLK
jgi:methionine-rich copper-binding protein CopC